MTVDLACVQNGASCLYLASSKGHLEVVKFLCEQGGKELLMLTNKASGLLHLSMFVLAFVQMYGCVLACDLFICLWMYAYMFIHSWCEGCIYL